jgi:hypothetical protein
MFKLCKIIFSSILVLAVTACLYKPFQPSPPAYTRWIKKNVGHEGVKKAMRDCGYKYIYNHADITDTTEDFARRENCMFKNGFQYNDGYKGICSLSDAGKVAACHSSN